ncbi:MAG: hypothetical protein ACM34L_07785, partial [Gemmatimonas sp.]
MTRRIALMLVGLSIGLLWNAARASAEPAPAGLQAIFDAMEKGLRGGDEALFKAQWYADGYD